MSTQKGYDSIVKDWLREIFGRGYSTSSGVGIDFGTGCPRARIDGTIAGRIAVEIESRVDKQIRGALLDLICHPLSQKLLIILPIHMTDAARTTVMCRNILARFLPANSFRVVLFARETFVEDIREAASELGWNAAATGC